MCHSKLCHKMCNHVSLQVYLAAMDETIEHFWCKSISIYLLIKAIENGRRFIRNAMRNLKKSGVGQETGFSPLNAESDRGVTNNVMFAY